MCVDTRYTIISTPSPSIQYDLAQLYQKIPYLNVPGTWYLSWKRSPTRNGFTVCSLYLDIECYRRTAAVCVQPGQHRVTIIRTRSDAGAASVEVTTCSRAAQPLYHRTVTSLPMDSSNRNIVINWLVKPLFIWVYSTARG